MSPMLILTSFQASVNGVASNAGWRQSRERASKQYNLEILSNVWMPAQRWLAFFLLELPCAHGHEPTILTTDPNLQHISRKSGLKNVKIESSSCRCTTTLTGEKLETKKPIWRILQTKLHTPQDFRKDSGHASERDLKKMVLNAHSQSKRFVERLVKKKTSVLYNGESATAKLSSRILVSVSQLSIYGAVADWCEALAQQI